MPSTAQFDLSPMAWTIWIAICWAYSSGAATRGAVPSLTRLSPKYRAYRRPGRAHEDVRDAEKLGRRCRRHLVYHQTPRHDQAAPEGTGIEPDANGVMRAPPLSFSDLLSGVHGNDERAPVDAAVGREGRG
jgi:hypothetical protein